MTFNEAEHLDWNTVAIWLVCWWDAAMWWVREMQIAQNKMIVASSQLNKEEWADE